MKVRDEENSGIRRAAENGCTASEWHRSSFDGKAGVWGSLSRERRQIGALQPCANGAVRGPGAPWTASAIGQANQKIILKKALGGRRGARVREVRGTGPTERGFVSATLRAGVEGHLARWSSALSSEAHLRPVTGATSWRDVHMVCIPQLSWGLWGHPGFPAVLLKPYLKYPVLSLPV